MSTASKFDGLVANTEVWRDVIADQILTLTQGTGQSLAVSDEKL